MAHLTFNQAGEGETLHVAASTMLMVEATWTRDAYCIMEQIIPPELVAPVHSHADEDQVLWVLEGSLVLWADGEEVQLDAGGVALRPAGIPHSMWNATASSARILEITSPAPRFQAYMRAVSALRETDQATESRVREVADQHGMTFYPDKTAEIVARTGLSTTGGFWTASDTTEDRS